MLTETGILICININGKEHRIRRPCGTFVTTLLQAPKSDSSLSERCAFPTQAPRGWRDKPSSPDMPLIWFDGIDAAGKLGHVENQPLRKPVSCDSQERPRQIQTAPDSVSRRKLEDTGGAASNHEPCKHIVFLQLHVCIPNSRVHGCLVHSPGLRVASTRQPHQSHPCLK